MSQPAGPPPYDAVYPQGMHTNPVQIQPQPQHIYVVQHQPQPVIQVHGGSMLVASADGPTVVVCPTCNHMIRTNAIMSPGVRTHLCAFLLCACGLWPCCPIPYCMPSCNNVDHFCSNCNSYIGSYRG